MSMKPVMLAGACVALVALTLAQGEPEPADSAAQQNAERALQVLRAACDNLAAASTVKVSSDGTYDQITPEGIRMELGGRRTITLQRPDRLVVESEGDTGTRVVVFNRGRLGILSRSEQFYGEATLAPTLDQAVDQLAREYGMVLPTADLLLSDPFEALTGAVRLAAHLGEHTVVGKPCDHLAFQTEAVDFQIWVEKSQPPVIRKFVIAFREAPGVPQFRAVFHQWEFDTKLPSTAFDFKPPQDYAKVDFEPEAPEASDPADDE